MPPDPAIDALDAGSVSRWLDGLRDNDEAAVERLWQRYFPQLVQAARARYGDAISPTYDAEDAAQSAFAQVCRHAARRDADRLQSRDDLWRLLIAATRHKIIDRVRHETAQKRGGERPTLSLDASLLPGAADGEGGPIAFAAPQPTPETLAMLRESLDRLLARLRDDTLRRIALALLRGETQDEIAATLGVSVRTVRRKLALIQEDWSRDDAPARDDASREAV